jgi:hypothetical protein
MLTRLFWEYITWQEWFSSSHWTWSSFPFNKMLFYCNILPFNLTKNSPINVALPYFYASNFKVVKNLSSILNSFEVMVLSWEKIFLFFIVYTCISYVYTLFGTPLPLAPLLQEKIFLNALSLVLHTHTHTHTHKTKNKIKKCPYLNSFFVVQYWGLNSEPTPEPLHKPFFVMGFLK